MLTLVYRAWDMKRDGSGLLVKPVVVCPAMNTMMYEHPLTGKQLEGLVGYGIRVMGPISKTLACGETGIGAMEEVKVIAKGMRELMGGQSSNK